jgi:crossover junction endodeoxyribonuclease RuvC
MVGCFSQPGAPTVSWSQNLSVARPLVILGIDPALTCTGYGLLRADGDRYEALDFGTIATPAQAPIAERLLRIHEALSDVIRDSRPDEIAVEDFIVGHVRAAVAVGEARAAALLAAAEAGLPVALYKPLEIKQFVTSYGRGSKDQVALMVQALLKLDEPPGPADAADALAVALCHALKRDSLPIINSALSSRRSALR